MPPSLLPSFRYTFDFFSLIFIDDERKLKLEKLSKLLNYDNLVPTRWLFPSKLERKTARKNSICSDFYLFSPPRKKKTKPQNTQKNKIISMLRNLKTISTTAKTITKPLTINFNPKTSKNNFCCDMCQIGRSCGIERWK